MSKEPIRTHCRMCGFEMKLNLQGIILGLCGTKCTERAGMSQREWELHADVFIRLFPHWEEYLRLQEILT